MNRSYVVKAFENPKNQETDVNDREKEVKGWETSSFYIDFIISEESMKYPKTNSQN